MKPSSWPTGFVNFILTRRCFSADSETSIFENFLNGLIWPTSNFGFLTKIRDETLERPPIFGDCQTLIKFYQNLIGKIDLTLFSIYFE